MTLTAASQSHMHKVLRCAESHVDDTAVPWRVVRIIGGRLTIETDPGDLATVCAAFGLGAARPEPRALSSGEVHVVVPFSATGTIDGSPLRIWAPGLVGRAAYAALVEAMRPGAAR